MFTKILIISLYVVIALALGLIVSRKKHSEGYFLADRKLGAFIFIGTMTATNLSAFTVFGTSGAGYRDGLAFFPIMGFGTGFMAITFWIVGTKVWELGKTYGLVTPAELIHNIYNNRPLSIIFSLVLIVFTLPYLALQPYAAGKVLGQLFGIPTSYGAIITTLIIIAYTMRGGLRAIALTDIFQGILMFVLLVVSLVVVASYYGGIGSALESLRELDPALLSREGRSGFYTPEMCFSFIALWFFCDPMFPQIFQRFYAAKSDRVIKLCSVAYPLLCTAIFIIPVTIGAIGNLVFPNLTRGESDSIMPMLMTHIGGDIFGTLVLTAGIAALMSTMDSQLLTLSSIFTRDLLPLVRRGKINENSTRTSRLFVIILAGCGLLIALTTNTTILSLGMTAFTGLAVLFPTVVFGLYLKERACPKSAIASIIIGELLVIAYHYKALPTGSFLGAVPILVATTSVYLSVQALYSTLPAPSLKTVKFTIFGIFLLSLATIPHTLSTSESIHLYLPTWVWYFIALSIVQSLLFFMLLRRNRNDKSV